MIKLFSIYLLCNHKAVLLLAALRNAIYFFPILFLSQARESENWFDKVLLPHEDNTEA